MKTVGIYKSDTEGRSIIPGRGISTLADFLLHPIFLMTKPLYYDPNPALRIEKMGVLDNEMTANSRYENFSPDVANIEHARLRVAKFDLGASIVLDEGHPDHFDGVYSADPSITFIHLKIAKGQITGVHFETIASFFYNHSRDGEVERQIGSIQFLKRYLSEKFGISVTSEVYTPNIHCEGTGDNVYDISRDMFFSGYKPKTDTFSPTNGRSDPDFHTEILQGRLNIPTFGFEVQNGCFHCDVVSVPTGKGDIVVYPGGMTDADYKRIQELPKQDGKKLFVVSSEDAKRYAQNMTSISENVVISAKTSPEFRHQLEDNGYYYEQTNLDQFIKQSGGGAKCLGNRIILRRDERQKALELLDYSL